MSTGAGETVSQRVSTLAGQLEIILPKKNLLNIKRRWYYQRGFLHRGIFFHDKTISQN